MARQRQFSRLPISAHMGGDLTGPIAGETMDLDSEEVICHSSCRFWSDSQLS